jgi:hypothetical protein
MSLRKRLVFVALGLLGIAAAYGAHTGLSGTPCDVCTWLVFAFSFLLMFARQDNTPTPVRAGGHLFRSLDVFVEETARELGLEGSRRHLARFQLASPTAAQFRGKLASGREAFVSYEDHPHQENECAVRLAVSADPAATVEITKETLLQKLGDLLGLTRDLQVGSPAFDAEFRVHASDAELARKAVGRGFKTCVEKAFLEFPVIRISLEGGKLTAIADDPTLPTTRYRALLELLDVAAATFDRVPLVVRVLGGERRAFKDAEGKARCAYCHDEVSGEEPDLTACVGCKTVLHDGCWQDLGRCPTLGCSSRGHERSREPP